MSGYGFYGLQPGERIKFTKKENGKKVSKVVKVEKEYPNFVLVEVAGRMGNYCTSINKSWIFTIKCQDIMYKKYYIKMYN